MINPTEKDERDYLEEVKQKLEFSIQLVDSRARQFSEELRQKKEYIFEHQSGMDEADMVAAEQSVNRMAFSGESTVARKRKLMKLRESPYFGRIDFLAEEKQESHSIYIGIYTFFDESQRENLIYDWRAPISSMFYDFELGEGWYQTPTGKVKGIIELKRQYKIRQGRMEFMIENEVNIHDEVLQKELSHSSDDKMKNIVATIQRDQNAVIRNETASVMIIQGVAGSGKTSIALHRIAFLLYRFREDIAAKDILIISPNKVFADYISNVLPELGEEQIPEIGMEELAADLLENKYVFQSFFQQVSFLLEKNDTAFSERIKFKSSFEFVSSLNKYLIHIENNHFAAKEIQVAGVKVKDTFVKDKFRSHNRVPMLKRVPLVVKDVLENIRNNVQRKLSGQEKGKVWEAVSRMFKAGNVHELYRGFYQWIGKADFFRMTPNGQLEYGDVFPLIYCKMRLEGVAPYNHVKHLLVDEMQDYTPIQYAVLARLFHCKKTILGDVSQIVNPYSSSSLEHIHQVFPHADTVKLFRSYRSTFEITSFAQRILSNPDLIAMERHGTQPNVRGYQNREEEMIGIKKIVEDFKTSGRTSLGILCKTSRQAETLHQEIKSFGSHLLTAESTHFTHGIIITSIHLSKGLEFDEVIVPFASGENYKTDVDKGMLYIACTRAMHLLTLTFDKKASAFLNSFLAV
jgi:DNA helicase-2/ATP-dependent DNA helicase PcrA